MNTPIANVLPASIALRLNVAVGDTDLIDKITRQAMSLYPKLYRPDHVVGLSVMNHYQQVHRAKVLDAIED